MTRVDLAPATAEDPLHRPRTQHHRLLVTLPHKAANGPGSRFQHTTTLPQGLLPYIPISSASLDLTRCAWDAPSAGSESRNKPCWRGTLCPLLPNKSSASFSDNPDGTWGLNMVVPTALADTAELWEDLQQHVSPARPRPSSRSPEQRQLRVAKRLLPRPG